MNINREKAAKAKDSYRTLCNFVNDDCVTNILKFCNDDQKLRSEASEFCNNCLTRETIYGFGEILEIAKIYDKNIPEDLAALLTLCERILVHVPQALSEEDFDEMCCQMLSALEDITQRCPVLGQEFQDEARKRLVYRSNDATLKFYSV